MATLDGEKIERLLFQEGFDFSQITDGDFDYLNIHCGEQTVKLGPIWTELDEDNWVLDDDDVTLTLYLYHTAVASDSPYPTDEDDLVNHVIDFIGGSDR